MIRSIRERIEFFHFSLVHRCPLFIIRQWQTIQLRRLVRHAFLNVPMWREIFSGANINEENIEGLESLTNIPLTSKDTYIGKMGEEYVDISHQFIRVYNTTSGTSGKPFRTVLPSQYVLDRSYVDFALLRFLLWNGRRFGDIASTKIAYIKRKTYSSQFRLGLSYADFRKNPKKVYSRLAEFKPEVLVAYPSVLLDIARMIKTDKTLPPLTPRYISSSGEVLTHSVRSFVNEQLDSEVYNRYALEEVGVVGIECAMHDGFHINSESIIVEITDKSGKPLPDGEHGNVVITDLINYNMPFIRYDTGDRGSISFETCVCGLHTPRLWIEGRNSVYLTFGNRRIYYCLEFDVLDTFMYYILQWQVVKCGEHEMLLRIVPGPAWGETTMQKVKECMRPVLRDEIRMSIELVTSIPKTLRGKSNLAVDETVPVSSHFSS